MQFLFDVSRSRSLLSLLACAIAIAGASRAFAQDANPSTTEATSPETTDLGGAPTATGDVAQEEDDDSATTPVEGAAELGASPGQPAASPAQATTEESAEQSDPAVQQVQPPAYRGSILSWQHGITANTLSPGAQLTYDPTYYWSFFAQPRWYFDSQNFLVLTLGAGIEWTDSAFTTHDKQFEITDLVAEWRHAEAIEGFVFLTSVRLAAPTSLASIAAERIINVGGSVTAVRVFPEAASFTIALVGGARYWFAGTNTPGTALSGGETFRCQTPNGIDSPCSQTSALSTEQARFTGSLTLSVAPASGLTIASTYALGSLLGYGLADANVPAIGGPATLADASTHWRPITYWGISVAYDVLPWLNLALGYQSAGVFNLFLNQGGNPTNVFYNPESELYLSVTVAVDGLIDAFQGQEEDGLTPEERQRRRQGLSAGPSRGASF